MEVVLLVSIAAMTFHHRRMDVLSGRYFGNDQSDDVMPDAGIGCLSGSERRHSSRMRRRLPSTKGQSRFLTVTPNRYVFGGGSFGVFRSAALKSPISRRRRLELMIRDVRVRCQGLRSRPAMAAGSSQTRAALPEGIRIYAVGDVHGRSDLLERLLAAIDADCEQRPVRRPIIVFVGDYIDRGPKSRNVLDLLLRWQQSHEAIFLRGNHETFLQRFLADPRSLDEWRRYGGLETLLSYGLKPSINTDRDEQTRLATQFADMLPPRASRFSAIARIDV